MTVGCILSKLIRSTIEVLNMKNVTFFVTGQGKFEAEVNAGATLADAASVAGVTLHDGATLNIAGSSVTSSALVNDHVTVTVSPPAKGNS